LFLTRAGVENQKVVDVIALIIKEFQKIKHAGVNPSEFKRAREYLSGQLLLGLEDTMDHMLWIGEEMATKNRVKSLKNVLKRLERIKPGDIKRIAKDVFDPKRYNLAVVGPVTGPQKKAIQVLLKT